MITHSTYYERVSSNRTETLFLALALLFLMLSRWRVRVAGFGALAAVFLILFIFFLFYWLNYRTLIIRLTPAAVELRFGLSTWRIAADNAYGGVNTVWSEESGNPILELDHRVRHDIIDGAPTARFVQRFKALIECGEGLTLESKQ